MSVDVSRLGKTAPATTLALTSPKNSCALATVAALPTCAYAGGNNGVGATLTASSAGVLTIDGVVAQLGMRVLVKDQADPSTNGIYDVTTEGTSSIAFVLTRAFDFDESFEIPGAQITIQLGTDNSNTTWLVKSNQQYTLGTTPITFLRHANMAHSATTGQTANDHHAQAHTNADHSDIGTAFPGSPSAGRTYFRTDLGWLCYYDGTRWLTSQEFSVTLGHLVANVTTGITGVETYAIGSIRTDYAPYVTRPAIKTYSQTTNDGSNYWTWNVNARNAAFTASTTVLTFTTAADTVNVWTSHEAAPSTANPANNAWFELSVSAKTGAPGTAYANASIYYRLIVT